MAWVANLEARRLQRYEGALCKTFDCLIVTSLWTHRAGGRGTLAGFHPAASERMYAMYGDEIADLFPDELADYWSAASELDLEPLGGDSARAAWLVNNHSDQLLSNGTIVVFCHRLLALPGWWLTASPSPRGGRRLDCCIFGRTSQPMGA